MGGPEEMTEKEMIKNSLDEFERLQKYMLLADKDSEVYKEMKYRYKTLKLFFSVSGVPLTEIDYINE